MDYIIKTVKSPEKSGLLMERKKQEDGVFGAMMGHMTASLYNLWLLHG